MNFFFCQIILSLIYLLCSRQICNANIEEDNNNNIENTNSYKIIITNQQRFMNDNNFHQKKQKHKHEMLKQRQRQRKLGKRTLKKKNSDTDNIFNRHDDDNYVYDDDHSDYDNSNNADDAIYIGKGKGSYYDDDIYMNDGKGKGSGSSKGKGGMGSKQSGTGKGYYDDDYIGKGKGSKKSEKGKGYDDDYIGVVKGKGGDIIGTRAPTRAPPTLSLAPPTRSPRTMPPTFSPTVSPTKRPRTVSVPNNVNFTAEGSLDHDNVGNCKTKADGNIGTQTDTEPIIANYRYELQTTSNTLTSQVVQDWIIPDLEISFSNVLAPYVLNLSECNSSVITPTNTFVTTKSSNIHLNQRHMIQQLQNIPTSIIPIAALGMSVLPLDTVETTRFCQNSASSIQSCYVIIGKLTIYVNNTTNERRRRMQLNDDEILIISKYYSDLMNDIIKQWISSTNNFTNINPLIQGLYINEEISSDDDDVVAVKDLEPFIQTDDSNNTNNVIIGVLCGAVGCFLLFATVGYIQRRRFQSSQQQVHS